MDNLLTDAYEHNVEIKDCQLICEWKCLKM